MPTQKPIQDSGDDVKDSKKMWELCPTCKQLRLHNRPHKCPQSMLVKREVEIEQVVDDEIMFLDIQIDNFWNDPHVRFLQYLASQGKI
jgi:hypothetical protein